MKRLGIGAERLSNRPGAHQHSLLVIQPRQACLLRQLIPRWHWQPPPVTKLLYLPLDVCSGFGRVCVDEGDAVEKRPGVQIHQLGEAIGDSVSHAGDHDPGVAVPKEHNVAEVFVLEDVHDVGYVGLKVYLWTC